ncbi:hypothetical protein [Schlesneria paludicola]|uniref:hypothetical protein n=1 Tax=Schlesneria paludicola TaxID=360056 RepID=UPI00029A720C|nr:hypothetical protein [Schlesneria paludicola]
MPRFFPPHLMFLFGLLILVIWMMLVRYFRRSNALQAFVADIVGDETAETALRNFHLAKQRLERHLADDKLDSLLRHRIEATLGQSSEHESIVSEADR